ncbi:hypothetical protein D9619_010821 [Psilocybe cf. subviscida]|uniref:S-adenosyl-L-methionine-dependent methyltransferase n=1 Tax=Psilocybe cf. subviscida TaxID=2480587 RepID=A0A8H5B8S4_9AGAR|nr:hypothetical protein D9619_010821 [Psilocybe cf. subviscida]
MSSTEEPFCNDSRKARHAPLNESYLMPSDDVEEQRLHEQQKLLSELFDGRVVVPPVEFNEGSEVLDIATGSGAWVLDFAARYPSADLTKIICIDIGDALFPKSHPPNMTFQANSALQMPLEWTDRFTLVHQRLIIGGVKYDEWEALIQDIYRVTAPGGWVQLCENNAIYEVPGVEQGPATKRLLETLKRLGDAIAMDLLCTRRIEELMNAAGFGDVRVEERVTPLGAWNGEASRRHGENMMTVLHGLKAGVLMFGGLGMVRNGEEYEAVCNEAEREWAEGPGAYVGWYVFTGRKPQ